MYYNHKQIKKEEITKINYQTHNKKTNKIIKIITIVIIILSIIGCGILSYQIITGKINYNLKSDKKIAITAHRGASNQYPENTMAAFKGAKELGADWIELDVQQTKDQKIIVSHDTNLYRTTGVKKNIINLTYAEIAKLDAGSFFSKDFAGEKIPLLEDVLIYAKENNLKLNIELKPTGKEKDFEKQVIDLVNQYDYKDMCIVTSQVYKVLINIKDYDDSIRTAYVTRIAYGNITDLDKADVYSIKASNVNSTLVNKIHNEGKEILVWTVNDEDIMQKMIDLDVDNIITNDITLGKSLILKKEESNLLTEYLKIVFNN